MRRDFLECTFSYRVNLWRTLSPSLAQSPAGFSSRKRKLPLERVRRMFIEKQDLIAVEKKKNGNPTFIVSSMKWKRKNRNET